MNDRYLLARIAGMTVGAYVFGRLVGYYKGQKKGKREGEYMLAQAKAIQRHNAEFVEEQYEIINEKIREINEFYED